MYFIIGEHLLIKMTGRLLREDFHKKILMIIIIKVLKKYLNHLKQDWDYNTPSLKDKEMISEMNTILVVKDL